MEDLLRTALYGGDVKTDESSMLSASAVTVKCGLTV